MESEIIRNLKFELNKAQKETIAESEKVKSLEDEIRELKKSRSIIETHYSDVTKV